MRTAYFDCCSGVSGNMLLAGLLDSGLPEELLRDSLEQLQLPGWKLEIKTTILAGIHACSVQVQADETTTHRHLQDIQKIIQQADLPAPVSSRAIAVFKRLARAEAKVHGTSIEAVHFHEVGAKDAIIDIVGVVAGCHHLGLEKIVCSPLPMPGGWFCCQHGQLPLPAPAVCELLRGIPVYGEPLQQELVTPTGAALVTELCDLFGPMPAMNLEQCGYGAGSMQRQDGRPNLLRILTGNSLEEISESQLVQVIETHLDDWNAELWPHVSARLLAAHALDVSLVPILMKKGRPGYLLRLLCDPAHALELKELILNETSAIGLRFHSMERMTLARTTIKVKTPWGTVQAKQVTTGRGVRISPEYEDCRRLAEAAAVPLQEVYTAVAAGLNPDG
jgi:uncharacterized protein (TIGR00299 family) protein